MTQPIPPSRATTARAIVVLAAAAMFTSAGCANVDWSPHAELAAAAAPTEVQACADWLASIDATVERAGVRDAEATRVAGFPYLRVNRLLASFRQQAASEPAAFAAWQDRLRALDERGRTYELENLPAEALKTLGVASPSDALARVASCGALIARFDATSEPRKAALVERAQVPDDYAEWKRVAGLYPIVKLPFYEFAKGWQKESSETFRKSAEGDNGTDPVRRYRLTGDSASAATVSKIFANLKTDALGIPQLSDRDAATLLAAYAPVYELATTGDYDRFGVLHWGTQPAPEVDAGRPTAYTRVAFTRDGARTLVQLVYMIWFPERPDSGWFDVLSGKLDGLIFRVTLDDKGLPLIYDSIHPCGCYHMFFPTPSVKPLPPPETRLEWAFIPRSLPAVPPPQRVVLRLTSRSHYLIDVHPDSGEGGEPATYALVDDGVLRTLPTAGGTTRSAFAPNGIVPGTQRGERMFVWALGIEDAGAMREWGHHATALVGRRHFDDADLIARRFQLPTATATSPASPASGG